MQFSDFTPEIIQMPQNISSVIDSERYNGQVNLIKQPDPNAFFKMQEKVAIKNKSTEYRGALSGNDWEENLLSKVFFSVENIQILQNGLRAGVYEMSGDRKLMVPPQNIDHLKIIMRSTYLQHAQHDMNAIREEVAKLNNLVLQYAVPNVYNEAMGYLKYLEDKSTLVVPLDLPKQNDRVYKQLQPVPFIYHPGVSQMSKTDDEVRRDMLKEEYRKISGLY